MTTYEPGAVVVLMDENDQMEDILKIMRVDSEVRSCVWAFSKKRRKTISIDFRINKNSRLATEDEVALIRTLFNK